MNVLMMTSAAPERTPVSTNEKVPPLGVGLLISVMKRAGHRVFFSDQYLRPSDILDSDFLNRNKIEAVGIYTNTICYQNSLKMFEKLQSKRVKGDWKGKIMVGGPHTSVGLNTIPEYVDHIVVGEGEKAILGILDGSIKERITVGEKVDDLDSLPLPAWEEFIHLPYGWTTNFVDAYPVYTFNTSRGCPFNCKFCSVKAVWGRTYRYMSPERVVDDVIHVNKHYGAKGVYFREDHFTLNKNRTVAFCELLLKNSVEIDWLCETRADQLDDLEYVKLMARSGCKAFYIGVESGSQRMLDFFDKKENVEQFVKAFDNARESGIKTYASFIVGAPTETKEDMMLTEQLINRIRPDFTGMNIFIGLPGSQLYDYALENGLYEYIDENRILYMKGHNQRVDRYYGGKECYKTPVEGNRKVSVWPLVKSILRPVKRTICRKICG